MTHTPGPWKVTDTDLHGRCICATNDRGMLVTVGHAVDSTVLPTEANANLIAAAPAMLEALKAARDFIAFEGIGSMKEGLVADMDSIISQAEGKE